MVRERSHPVRDLGGYLSAPGAPQAQDHDDRVNQRDRGQHDQRDRDRYRTDVPQQDGADDADHQAEQRQPESQAQRAVRVLDRPIGPSGL